MRRPVRIRITPVTLPVGAITHSCSRSGTFGVGRIGIRQAGLLVSGRGVPDYPSTGSSLSKRRSTSFRESSMSSGAVSSS